MNRENIMRWIIIILLVILFVSIIGYANRTHAMSVGVVSDIHAGGLKSRPSGKSIVYPSKALSYFEKAVQQMKAQGVEVIVALGDNTNDGVKKYQLQLKKIEAKYGIKVLWVKGNHDTRGKYYLGESTYFYDKGDTRFIVLNTTLCAKKQINGGCMAQSQKDFFNANKTDKTVVLQHFPVFNPIDNGWRDDFKFEKDMTIWSGHWHRSFQKDGQTIFPALTEHKKLNYRIINL